MKNCARQALTEILLSPVKRLDNILGTMVELQQISRKERFPRKKYIGVWRCLSVTTSITMRRFPAMVIRKITKNSRKRRICKFGRSPNPRSMNSETAD